MPTQRPSTTLFEDAIDVPLWLEADRATPFADRSRRDRAIASQLTVAAADARVRGWWQRLGIQSHEHTGARLQRTRRLVTAVMTMIGAVVGSGVALAAFHYDGTRPVNVVTLLAVLVITQLVLLALTLLLIPRGVPGLRAVQDLLETINPGALAASIYRKIAAVPAGVAPLFGWHPGRSTAAGRFAKWQLLFWSQTFAVAFNCAAIATGVALVTFTDLAFGWSTTLHLDAAGVARIVDVLSTPWQSWAPAAVPDQTLIERSLFFRLDGTRALDVGASRALTGWWPFTILAMLTYGLIPRLALWSLSVARLRTATHGLLLEDPRVTALLDRMATPAIETNAVEPENPRAANRLPDAAHQRAPVGAAHAIIWGRSIDSALAEAHARRTLGVSLSKVVEAGGGRTLDDDRTAIDGVRGAASVVVFTRAWEPPLLEFLDFLVALRTALGADTSIVVSPIGENGGAVESSQQETWARAIGRACDPHLYLETGAA